MHSLGCSYCLFAQELSTDEGIDWWSKYYASSGDLQKAGIYLDKGYDKMMVYNACIFIVDLSVLIQTLTLEGASWYALLRLFYRFVFKKVQMFKTLFVKSCVSSMFVVVFVLSYFETLIIQ